jgi:predicted permease
MPPRLHRRLIIALRSFVRRRTADEELDDELRFHVEQLEALARARGRTSSDAHWHARRHVGSLDRVKDACRDVRTLRPLEHFLQDVRFGARLLARGPAFAAVAILSLAFGIGASSAIFSLTSAIVLRPLPVDRPEELFIAQFRQRDDSDDGALRFSHPFIERARELLAGRAELCAHSSIESLQVGARGGSTATPSPEAGRVQLVSAGCFGMLGQRAQIGRLLFAADNVSPGQHRVAVISDAYWNHRFGRAASVLDAELIINGTPVAIIGVTAPGFFGTTVGTHNPDVWAPIAMQPELRFAGRVRRDGGDLLKPWPPQPELSWLNLMLRVPDGGAPAVTEVLNAALRHESASRGDPSGTRRSEGDPITLQPGTRGFSPMRNQLTTPLVALLIMVGLLLAIACANIASLLLARATNRDREMAIRLSIGAGRGRLVCQLLTESLLLAAIGGALGLAMAHWGSRALLTLLNRGAAVTGIDVSPDWRVVVATGATSIVTALLFGLLPALRSTRVSLTDTLKAHTRGAIGAAGRVPVGKLLIAGQMAFAILLLIVAALFARSLQALTRVDVGYDRDRVLVARIDPRSAGYTVAELPVLYNRLVERLTSLPGVTSVSASANGPFSGSRSRGDFDVEGYTPARDEPVVKDSEWVTTDYFRTVGLTIKQGRGFGPQDSANGRRVSVINETMARRYFRNQNPIGRRWGNSRNFEADGFEIVGIVEDARYNDVKATSIAMSYLLAVQSERYVRSLEVRTSGSPAAMATAIRRTLRESEARLPVDVIETLDERVTRSMGLERLLGWLTMAFGSAALGLACLGLYGTISYAVTRRTAELGLRMALGAGRTGVQWLILREALTLVLVGVVVGVPLAMLAAHALKGLLYGTAPSDLLSYGAAMGGLVAVSALAAYIPARRASRLDPMHALRTE